MGQYTFLAYLAFFQYSLSVVNFLISEKVHFFFKNLNPGNQPKARPIKSFWGNLKQFVYAGGWTAKTRSQLKNRIVASMKKIELNFIQAHMKSLRSRLENVARYETNSIQNFFV